MSARPLQRLQRGVGCAPSQSVHRRLASRSSVPRAAVHDSEATESSWSLWNGSDTFTGLDDRHDLPPLPLPIVTAPTRITVVRHGQSTWNAEGRIQGSTDLSELTEKGKKQATKAQVLLAKERFDRLFVSPLQRARQTADIVWSPRGDVSAHVTVVPQLREVDLYSFQGLVKAEGKALFGDAYKQWQKEPQRFEIAGHYPVRELWYRASLAWQTMLAGPAEESSLLVVAHNAVNQALLAVALGLPPAYFRRLPQTNGALNILTLAPPKHAEQQPSVTLECLNQSASGPFKDADAPSINSIALLSPASTHIGTEACARLLAQAKLKGVMTYGTSQAVMSQAQATVHAQQHAAEASHADAVNLTSTPSPSGSRSGAHQHAPPLAACGAVLALAPRIDVQELWESIQSEACCGAPGTSVVIVDPDMHAALVKLSLGIGARSPTSGTDSDTDISTAKMAPTHEEVLPLPHAVQVQYSVKAGGLSLLELPAPGAARIQCFNSAAHLVG